MGWTWDYVRDHMDLPRLDSLNKYWSDYPPLHVLVAGYLGIKPKAKAEEQDFSAIMAMFPQTPESPQK